MLNWLKNRISEIMATIIYTIISIFTLPYVWDNVLFLKCALIALPFILYYTIYLLLQNIKLTKELNVFQNPAKTDLEMLADKVILFLNESINKTQNFETQDVDLITKSKSNSCEIYEYLESNGLIQYRKLAKSPCNTDDDYVLACSPDSLITLKGKEYIKNLKKVFK